MEAKAHRRHEIDIDPRPEDVGTFKVYVSILMPGSFDERTPRRFLFSLQHDQSLSDCTSGLRELNDLLNKAGVTNRYADDVRSRFTRNFSRLLSSGRCFTADASSVYLLVRVIHHQINEVIQAFFTEATNNRPASKVVVGSCQGKYTIPRIRCLALTP
ncbi:hypothetical protein Bca52824_014302 [Brassica carinata]|uniref:Uncharacterized protein n=1 Tax=Brassica carinata TaxID=52824 RepID=A0A8X7VZV3_BRACI|nr:hypothetical protein Bca52824_014302 [Brassica carinata]